MITAHRPTATDVEQHGYLQQSTSDARPRLLSLRSLTKEVKPHLLQIISRVRRSQHVDLHIHTYTIYIERSANITFQAYKRPLSPHPKIITGAVPALQAQHVELLHVEGLLLNWSYFILHLTWFCELYTLFA